jgi:hypothetical protein
MTWPQATSRITETPSKQNNEISIQAFSTEKEEASYNYFC